MMRRIVTSVLPLLFALCQPGGALANAPTPVAIELVIAIDVSASVDEREYDLQIGGIAAAFRHPDVVSSIEALGAGGLAVALVQWSQARETGVSVPFLQVTDARGAKAFAFLVTLSPRRSTSSFTAIGSGIALAARLLEESSFEGRKRVIDVSGDGRSNADPHPEAMRDLAVARGIVVNGLAIAIDDDGLVDYYRRSVIGGPGAFVETSNDYDSFAEAFLRKLLRELMPQIGSAR